MSAGPRRAPLLAAITAHFASILAACGGEPQATAPATGGQEVSANEGSPGTEPVADPGPPGPSTAGEPPAEAPSARDTSTACTRAEPCCRAFVDAIGDDAEAERARRACDDLDRLEDLAGASGEACLAAIEGWRQALELRERDVPLSCR
jgi:hypothetical protein